ncbi:hypothetical protein A1F94_008587 [Pyrenophora tritici-repentis]|uniref:Uncharacterized protein n=1 Tax=Pyrenophora tritici-repentis TaxID=45151 RepID=A0A922SSY2_9PLEO|nr:hypothetical protein A1F94_008587 [Pyrenophora tritici-repentis]KAI0584717.1 hypothetical protein Alg130_05093 [Pyrenophora tritici-repentis]KAI0609535.1 hypothetical protein TUN205_06221 [Pyrenophora tritici-repentis]KAI0622129.1 hypothetical protein TUN199_05877 [Pyrenophora tritici-repentis]KAI1516521.1 hypothetical protein Ptr86124_005058 [Pyrenophora tritici-repentis]
MKITSLFTTFFFASAVMAAPGASSLKRSFRIVKNSDHPASTSVLEACAECPCDGFRASMEIAIASRAAAA